MSARQEDFVFAEHVLRRGFATQEQVEECLELLERLRGEMQLEESLRNILLKKGYLAPAQATVIDQAINPKDAARAKNQIEGYRLLRILGAGAMGSVYKADHLKLNIPVALKVLRVDHAKSKTQIQRLKREAHLAARLNHPNVVRSLDVGESNGFHYFAMEYVDGQTVRQHLRKGRIPEKEALRITRDVARALEAAHAEGVIHRDVKPGNIMLTRENQVKLADFGLARGQEPSDLTLEYASIGTPQYLAPEQARRGADATQRSDLFSLGATLYHMVTGRPPFAGRNLGEIFQQVLASRFAPPETLVPDLSLDVVYFIHRLMRGNPRERYASATELLVDLGRAERGERVAPSDFRGDYQAYLSRRRQQRLLVGSAAVTVLTVAVFFIVQFLAERSERERLALACGRINEFAAGELKDLERLAALRSRVREMEARRASEQCAPEQVAELDTRLARAHADITVLEEAERLLGLARAPGADYRTLYAGALALDGIHHGVNQRLEKIRAQVRQRSFEEVKATRGRLFTQPYETGAEAVDQLQAFVNDLDTRYVAIPLKASIEQELVRLQQLRAAWEAAEKEHGELVDTALRAGNYAAAQRRLGQLLRKRHHALRIAADLERTFLLNYPENDPRQDRIRREEEQHWREVVLVAVEKHLPSRPDEAERVLIDFSTRAEHTESLVDARLDTVRAVKALRLAEQKKEIELLEDLFRNALRQRAYLAAANRVFDTRTVWILEHANRYAELRARAEAVRGLFGQFVEGVARLEAVRVRPENASAPLVVPGTAFRRAQGDDEDRLLLRHRNTTHAVYLRDFEYEELLRVFAFDRDRKLEIARRGYFNASEAFAWDRRNPYRARELRRSALDDLFTVGDPWAADVKRLVADSEEAVRTGEARATSLYANMVEARERKDHERALSSCEELHARYGWTSFFRDKNVGKPPQLQADLRTLRRLAGEVRRRTLSGLPPRNFDFDPESGQVALRYTGKRWFPDEGRAPDGVDPKKWLLDKARTFWLAKAQEHGIEDGRAFFDRALVQLLDWSGPVTAGEDAYRLEGDVDANQAAVNAGKLEEFRILSLRNHVRPDRDWRIEFTVVWHAEVPVYFAVGAGDIHAGMLYLPELYGGGRGVSIFDDDGIVQDSSRAFSDFHQHLVSEKRRTKLDTRHGRAYLDAFRRGVPYRMRFERSKGTMHFRMAPLETLVDGEFVKDHPHTVIVSKQFPNSRLNRSVAASDGAFRFVSYIRFELRDVEVSGTLAGAGPG